MHNAASRVPPKLLTTGGALTLLGRLHAVGGALLGAAGGVPFEPLALSGTLVVGRLVHALLGAPLGWKVAIRHEGGPREPLAARVGDLVLEALFALSRTGLEAFGNVFILFTFIISFPFFKALFTLYGTWDKTVWHRGVFLTSFISFTSRETVFTSFGTFSEAFRKVGVLLTIVISFTSLEGSLALARAALKEALLVPGEGTAVQGPVLVGDLLLGLLLAQLWARGATVSPRGIIIVEQCVALVEADASLGRLLALIQIFSVRSLAHWRSVWWWWS